ncbi:MAG: DUF4278 domain-containing protein [Microcoleaceae cyanobacterium]
MQLKYRGMTYEYNPPQVENLTGKATGKYRGLDWRFCNLKKPPVLQPTHALTYRGVKYSNAPFSEAKQSGVPCSISEQARALMLNHGRTALKRDESMLGRLADEIGLNPAESVHHA